MSTGYVDPTRWTAYCSCGWTKTSSREARVYSLLIRHLESCGLCENALTRPHPTCCCLRCLGEREAA